VPALNASMLNVATQGSFHSFSSQCTNENVNFYVGHGRTDALVQPDEIVNWASVSSRGIVGA
jgi:hypothetical protein